MEDQIQRKLRPSWKCTSRCVVSLVSVFLTQFSLSLAPRFFPTFSLLPLTALLLIVVVGFWGIIRRVLQLRASASAFVFFTILFIWGVYVAVIRRAISPLTDAMFHAEIAMLIFGLYRIFSSDPGFVSNGPSCVDELVNSSLSDPEVNFKSAVSVRRARYCRHCKAHVKGFDHHCPAFGNCIGAGKDNHVLFTILLVGFIITEASYVACTYWFASESRMLGTTHWEPDLHENLAISTMLFCQLQVLWQVVFLAWHIYCISFNIKTDEWINWQMYPEFQLVVQPHPGQPIIQKTFRNPYDKGILSNIKEFFAAKE